MVNWDKVRQEYITGTMTQNALAQRYGVPRSTLAMRALRGGWSASRQAYRSELVEKGKQSEKRMGTASREEEAVAGDDSSQEGSIPRAVEEGVEAPFVKGEESAPHCEEPGEVRSQEEEGALSPPDHMEKIGRKLLEKVSKAVDELDVQTLREVYKEKEMIYDHPQRTDKATRETLTEREILRNVRSTVDRNGLKLITTALKELKEVLNIRDPWELRELEGKIAKLEREAGEEKTDQRILVTFGSGIEDCAE